MTVSTALGAPNVYTVPDELRRTLGAVRMDVCAFVGIAPRGPVRIPVEPDGCDESRPYVETFRERQRSVAVPVESWDQYLTLFGGYEGPGRLPYAVSNFFEQGGRRAYIVRVVHDYGDASDLAAVAELAIDNVTSSTGPVVLAARSEGRWGNNLRAALTFSAVPLEILPDFGTSSHLVLPSLQGLTPGTLLRLRTDDNTLDELRFVSQIRRAGALDRPDVYWQANFTGAALPGVPDSAEVVSADCMIFDADSSIEEHFVGVGLSSAHPRSIANVLYRESLLVNPTEGWIDAELLPTGLDAAPVDLRARLADPRSWFSGGEDRYADIVHEDFFDPAWVFGDPEPGSGIHALTHLQDLSMLVTPDLYVPEPLVTPTVIDDELLSNAEFSPCVDVAEPALEIEDPPATLPGLTLDATLPADLKRITDLQRRLITLADLLREFVVLLDIPPGLHQRQILRWRTAFASPYAAAYHPWLKISTLDDARDNLILLNPGAVAAGIIARQEQQFGVPHGPANVVARAIVAAEEAVSNARHDQLHPLGINVFKQQRDGVWLTAARTLSRDQSLRQLSVLRLMVMLRRVLIRQMQWVVFEPNGPPLWSDLRFMLEVFLRQLFVAGAFKGETEEQAYFVRCDSALNNRRVLDAGKLIVEIGVAPTEPLEFIVLRITRDGDGTLAVED